MTTTHSTRDRADGAAQAKQPTEEKRSILEQAGGWQGMLYSAIPVMVFATAISFLSLPVTIGISIAVAVAIAAFQLWRGARIGAASGGVFAVAASGAVSALTGSANDFFVIGIWAAFAAGIGTLVSMLMRRPVTALVWNAVHGGKHLWREDRPTLTAHYIATLAVTVMFAARFAVSEWLYIAGSTGGLAIADTIMGFPLTALAAVVVVWAFRRSTKRLIKSAEAVPAAQT